MERSGLGVLGCDPYEQGKHLACDGRLLMSSGRSRPSREEGRSTCAIVHGTELVSIRARVWQTCRNEYEPRVSQCVAALRAAYAQRCFSPHDLSR